MKLTFPNPSRSYDEENVAVRFMGYYGMVSVPFLIEKSALDVSGRIDFTEAALLSAFDASIKNIHLAARKLHANNRQTSYRIRKQDMV